MSSWNHIKEKFVNHEPSHCCNYRCMKERCMSNKWAAKILRLGMYYEFQDYHLENFIKQCLVE